MKSKEPENEQEWQRSMIEKMATEGFREQRRSRRWGIFFKLLVAVYILAIVLLPQTGMSFLFGGSAADKPDHVAVIEIKGPIAAGGKASAASINKLLRRAFDRENAKAVMLKINSPGGSPVQSGLVYDEINRLKSVHPSKTIYAVGTDIMASGAYYIASAADEIYVDKASLVGSIGVVMQGFGFDGLIDKLGIDRRVYTSGGNKSFMDSFKPENQEDIEYAKSLLDQIHQQFITAVTEGRGGKLDTDNKNLFSGRIWTGEESVRLGLVDGLLSPYRVATEKEGLDEIYTYVDGPTFSFIDYLVGSVTSSAKEALMEGSSETGTQSMPTLKPES